MGRQLLEQHGIERLAGLERHVEQEETDHQSEDRDRKGQRHVEHRPFGRFNLRLAENRNRIADRLDAGECAGAHAVRAHQQEQDAERAQLRLRGVEVGGERCHQALETEHVRSHHVENHDQVRDDENQEDGHERQNGLLDSAKIQDREQQDPAHREDEPETCPCRRQETEDGVGAAGNRNRDSQHIVDQQGATGDHPDPRRKELAGDEVPAAAGREQFDDLRVARADQHDGHHGHQRHEDAQMRVVAERQVRLLRAVTGRGEAVGSQADPGEEGDQRQLVEDPGRVRVAPAAHQQSPELRLWRCLALWRHGKRFKRESEAPCIPVHSPDF